MEKLCKECGIKTRNKVYCSKKCQSKGNSKRMIVPKIKTNCKNCDKLILATKSELSSGRKKYCSRDCKDQHQKKLYSNDGNPAFGSKKSKKWKEWNSNRMKVLWKEDANFRKKVRDGQKVFVKNNGYWPGTDEESNNKRRKTCNERYGVPHNWMCPEIRTKCDETAFKRYGVTAFEMMLSAQSATNITSIEKIMSGVLQTVGVEFKHAHYVYYNDDKNYRIYDFYVPSLSLLIEADGDYWHGNPLYFSSYTETQQINMANDEFKNQLASKHGYNLLRFWETDIKRDDFSSTLINKLRHYGEKD